MQRFRFFSFVTFVYGDCDLIGLLKKAVVRLHRTFFWSTSREVPVVSCT